ncbi:MAG: ribosome maturation factor RimM [Desulfobacterales bacterium]
MKISGAIPVAKIVGAHGLHGTCKVYCYGESGDILSSGGDIFVKTADGVLQSYEIDWAKPHSRTVLLALKGISDRSQTDKLIGCDIMIDKSNLPVLPAGTYYWHDLIGLSVFTTEGRFLGRLAAVMPTGSNDVYVVRRHADSEKGEMLIPALGSVVVEVNLAENHMRVDLPEGLA